MQCARAIPVAWLGSGSCQNRPSGWILLIIIIILAHVSRHPSSSPVSYETCAHSWLGQLTPVHTWMVRNETASLSLSKRPITVTVLTWMRAFNCHLSERKLLLLPSICILGNSLLDYHFLCLLPTGYLQPNDSWNNDLPSFSESFLDGPLLWVLSQTARTWKETATLKPTLTL